MGILMLAVQMFYVISGFYMALVLNRRYTGQGRPALRREPLRAALSELCGGRALHAARVRGGIAVRFADPAARRLDGVRRCAVCAEPRRGDRRQCAAGGPGSCPST